MPCLFIRENPLSLCTDTFSDYCTVIENVNEGGEKTVCRRSRGWSVCSVVIWQHIGYDKETSYVLAIGRPLPDVSFHTRLPRRVVPGHPEPTAARDFDQVVSLSGGSPSHAATSNLWSPLENLYRQRSKVKRVCSSRPRKNDRLSALLNSINIAKAKALGCIRSGNDPTRKDKRSTRPARYETRLWMFN
ncbi:hypothetical protein EVAR_79733_1 [Eumeta japonica]|uniref:Uncharacterized protein n=1 Tax=Eumeta variegata TaxID=151549 RepID=A0A4C1TC88_EUMVA|nr:hypothetical protein EVAR_79733_1 [Eumeta japonica]